MSRQLGVPPKLNVGDKVAAVTSSWGGPAAFPHRYATGKRQLIDEFGVEIVEMAHTLKDADWVYQNPKARAEDLMAAFADPSIKAIISTIGGDDSIRILPYLDLDVIRSNPKIFLGYSDSTITHMACFKAGLVSYSGPAIMAGFAENGGMWPYMVESLRQTLFSDPQRYTLTPNEAGWTVEHIHWGDPSNQSRKRKRQPCTGWQWLQGDGVWQGHLLGGCFEVFDFLRGTDFFPTAHEWQNAILFLETSEDAPPPSQLLYVLRSYAAMGILDRLSGILLGRPGGHELDPTTFAEYDQMIKVVVRDECGLESLPIITHMDFGHTDPMLTLPMGVSAEIDCQAQTITIDSTKTFILD